MKKTTQLQLSEEQFIKARELAIKNNLPTRKQSLVDIALDCLDKMYYSEDFEELTGLKK